MFGVIFIPSASFMSVTVIFNRCQTNLWGKRKTWGFSYIQLAVDNILITHS